MAKFLDETGLAYFWEKIKDYVAAHGGGSDGDGMPNFATQQFSTTVTVSSGYGSFSIPVSKTGYVPFGILSYNLNSSYYSFIALKLDLSQNEITGTVRHITNASASGSQTVYITVLFIGSGSIGLLKSDVINNLSSTITDQPLSAAQGKVLNDNMTKKSATLYMSGLQVTNTTNGRWNGSATRTVQGGDDNPYLSAPTGTSNTANCIYVKKSGNYLVSLICRFSAVANAGNVKFVTLWDVTAGGTAGLGALGRVPNWEDLSSTEIVYLTAGHYYTLGGRVEDGNCTISSCKAGFVALE